MTDFFSPFASDAAVYGMNNMFGNDPNSLDPYSAYSGNFTSPVPGYFSNSMSNLNSSPYGLNSRGGSSGGGGETDVEAAAVARYRAMLGLPSVSTVSYSAPAASPPAMGYAFGGSPAGNTGIAGLSGIGSYGASGFGSNMAGIGALGAGYGSSDPYGGVWGAGSSLSNSALAAAMGGSYGASGGGRGGTGGSWQTWDPQGTAYNMIYGNANGYQTISPELGASNLYRVANFVNNTGMFRNPNAGQAMASVAGAESSGNPFAVNPDSGATGLFQWLNTNGNNRQTNALNNLGGNFSPEAQAAVAMGEIYGGGYPGVYSALNNPASSGPGMRGAVINQFEGLVGYPGQNAKDVMNANIYSQQPWVRGR